MIPIWVAACCAWSTGSSVVVAAVVTLIVAAVALFYRYATSTYDTWREAGVPCPRPVPLFGNTFKMIAGLELQADTLDRIYRLFPDARVCGFYQMRTPFLMVRDPELIYAMLIKDFSHFTDHGVHIDPSVNLVARGLFFMNGEKWRTLRQRLSPGFTSGKLKGAQGQIRECGDQLTGSVARKSAAAAASGGGDGIEVTVAVGDAAVDVIGTCAFGMTLDTISDENSDFRTHVKNVLTPSTRQLFVNALGMLVPQVVKFLRLRAFDKDATEFFHSVFSDVLQYRTENNVVRNDLAQTLIEARNELVLKDTERVTDSTEEVQFCELDIIGNAILLFAAGSETVTYTASYCLYELAMNKDIQSRLRAEIISVKEKYNGELNNDFLMDLHYADMVLDETHRKYSIAWGIMREATQNYNIPEESLFIEKGQHIMIPMYSIHHDPKYYPDPETFDPERFTKEEKSKRPNGTFLPFGDGPRHCIGKRFAEMELKLMLSKILLKFEILPCEKTEIPIQMTVKPGLLTPKNGIWLKFREVKL